MGDMNAKIENEAGPHGKAYLMKMVKDSLILVLFQQPYRKRITWRCRRKNKSGCNQIDYVLCKSELKGTSLTLGATTRLLLALAE